MSSPSLPWWNAPRASELPAAPGLTLHASAAAPVAAPASVELRGLHLAYGGRPVLQNLSWQLQPGQVVGLLGRNGAGKTSLLESLLGLRDPQQGSALLFGQNARALDDAARARIGYAPQHSELFADLRADELLAYFRSFYPRWNEAKVEGLLSRWEVPRDTLIGRMSGGQQQRLSIIRALAHEPELLVLDEPVASLDPLARRDFLRELVEQVLDRGTTVVFSTHILSDLERVAFNVAFLQGGRIALQAPLDELLDEVVAVTASEAQLGARPRLGRAGMRWLLRRADAEGLDGDRVSLEDLFEALT